MRRPDAPVLIVGAGPVGLTASLLLAQQGIPCRVVDRREGPHRAPQAHVVNPRTLEIFRQLGLDTARLRGLATPREDGGHVSFVTCLTGPELGRLPYERQDDAVLAFTPEPILNLPQHVLEPVLLEWVEATPGIEVIWGTEWQELRQDTDGVTSRLRELGSGTDTEVRSRWLLAADGAGSRVRKQLDIPMRGPDRLQSFIMIHFEANLRPLVRDRPAIIYWLLDPEAVGSLIAHDIERTWVYMHPFDPETDPPESYDEARCAALVRGAIGADVPLDVRTVSPWHMTSQVAERYRAGRVFLVGDSAHRFPPAGGMGMNTGIQDAHDLVWKLALVDRGRADAALLDTYETERRPIAQQNADQSFRNAVTMLEMMTTFGLDREPAAARAHLEAMRAEDGGARVREAIEAQQDHFDMLGLQLGFSYAAGAVVPDGSEPAPVGVRTFTPTGRPGARVPHAWVIADGRRRSSLDLLAGDAFTLVTGPGGHEWLSAAEGIEMVPLHTLAVGRDCADPDGGWLRACGIEPGGALLVRPDQHVAWRVPDDAPNPREALSTALGTLLHPGG